MQKYFIKDFSINITWKQGVLTLCFFVFSCVTIFAQTQLGIYSFQDIGVCNANPENLTVTAQPANASFNTFVRVGSTAGNGVLARMCPNPASTSGVCRSNNWNSTGTWDYTQYEGFTLAATAGYCLFFLSTDYLTFKTRITYSTVANKLLRVQYSVDGGAWTNMGADYSLTTSLTTVILNFPSTVTGSTIEFRFFAINVEQGTTPTSFVYGLVLDDVSLYGTISNGPVIGTIAGSPFCTGASVSVPYSTCGSYGGGNVFTAQLSNSLGVFASPVTIGTLASTASGTISATIPSSTLAGSAYRIRVISSNPPQTGADNGIDIVVQDTGIVTGTISPAVLCPGSTVTVPYTVTCGPFKAGNVFTAWLSDASGNFGAAVNIGNSGAATTGGSFTVTIPGGTVYGTAYRIRVTGSNPVRTGSDNGTDLTAVCPCTTVNKIADTNDGSCDLLDCSLREAITATNAGSGNDTIKFNISGGGPYSLAITLGALPDITQKVVIDGTTQPGYSCNPIIEINGAGAGGGVNGLNVSAGNTVIRGLVINRFNNYGISLSSNGNNLIEGNFIGTDVTGGLDRGNASDGIYISSSNGNTIGGTTTCKRNVISGNDGNGLYLNAASNNKIRNNFIGTSVTGVTAIGNSSSGISFFWSSLNNTLGGTNSNERNVISSNGQYGAQIRNSSTPTYIQGNYIGTDSSGASDLGNTSHGVYIATVTGNIIGGSVAGAGNVISGNDGAGIVFDYSASNNTISGNYIGVKANGTTALGNNGGGVYVGSNNGASNNTLIGGSSATERNVISGNTGNGITIYYSNTTTVKGNYIGTNAAGTAAVPNGNAGIYMNYVTNVLISERNIISGNTSWAIWWVKGMCNCVKGNVSIKGNYIGTNVAGTAAVSNGGGIYFYYDDGWGFWSYDTIGGVTAAERNVISGNNNAGIWLSGNYGTSIMGNYIGTNATATAAIPNTGDGMFLSSAGYLRIGTALAWGSYGAPNVISANGGHGINAYCGTGVTIAGNMIGTDLTGTSALGNTLSGIFIDGSCGGPCNATIGSTTATYGGVDNTLFRNVISGNGQNGIIISQNSSSWRNASIQNNYIGTNASGTAAIPNSGEGIKLATTTTQIGGTGTAMGNLISGNNLNGISISGSSGSYATLMQGNLIGTDVNGTADLGNKKSGIYISGSIQDSAGGTTAGARNIISGNDSNGVYLAGGANRIKILGNYIGTNITAAGGIGNSLNGVLIEGKQDTIGGASNNKGNIIAYNVRNGISVNGASADSNMLARNLIYFNGAAYKAINLNGTGNDAYAKPFGMSATASSVSGTAGLSDSVEVYKSTATSDPNCINAEVYLGTVFASAATGAWTLGGLTLSGEIVKAKARNNSTRNTSEFTCTASPLPVELLTFTAEAVDNKYVLTKWTTTTEINNDYFIVERSKDLQTWDYVGKVQGSGTTTDQHDYSLKDEQPYSGTSYYRLKQVDFNGDYEYYGPVPVRLDGMEIIAIFPNPASDHILYSVVSSDETTVTLTVIDVLGRKVMNSIEAVHAGQNNFSLSLDGTSEGYYLLRLSEVNGKSRTQKQFVVK